MTDHKLPNGHILRIVPATFSEAKALLQEVTRVLKDVEIAGLVAEDNLTFVKELLCSAIASNQIEEALLRCISRCQINEGQGFLAIKPGYFEPQENWENYVPLCFEVAKFNLLPFMKSLFAEVSGFLTPKEKLSRGSK